MGGAGRGLLQRGYRAVGPSRDKRHVQFSDGAALNTTVLHQLTVNGGIENRH